MLARAIDNTSCCNFDNGDILSVIRRECRQTWTRVRV